MALSRYEKENLAFLVGGGSLLAIFSITFRYLVGRGMFGIPPILYNIQYMIAIIVFGLLLILLWQANRHNTNYAYAILTFAFGLGLALPPATMTLREVVISLGLLPIVVGSGIYYYRFNDASNTLLVGFLALLLHEFWLFGVVYAILAYISTGQPLVFIGVILLTVMLVSIRRILMDEITKTQDDSAFAQQIKFFLDPLSSV